MDLTLPLQLGAFGVLLIVVYTVFRIVGTGQWIPKDTVDALLAARDAEIERANLRADEWHKAYEGERHVSEVLRDHNGDLIEVARTVKDVMQALAQVAEGRDRATPSA